MKNNFSYFLEEYEKLSFFIFTKLRSIDSIVYGFTTKNWTKEALIENLNLNDFSIIFLKQIHSDRFHFLNKKLDKDLIGDALITNGSNLLLTIKTADCLPILIFDKEAKVVSAIHVGWKGVIRKFTKKVVLEIVDSLDIKPSLLFALLGPCICSKCYEVGEDVKEILEKEWDSFSDLLIPSHKEGKYQLDLRKANTIQLKEMGLKQGNIFHVDLCTKCNTKLFYSNRQEPNSKGRMISFIGLRNIGI